MVRKFIHKYKFRNIIIFISFILSSLLTTGSSIMLTFSLDALVNLDLRYFVIWNLVSFIMWVLLFILNYFQSAFLEETTQKIIADIRLDIINRIANSSYNNFRKQNEGTYVSWLNNDMKEIETNGINQYYSFWNNLILTVISTLALFSYHYSLVLMTFTLMVILMITPKLFNKKMNKATADISEENEHFSSELQDTVSGYEEYYNYNIFNRMKNKISGISKRLTGQKVQYEKTMASVQGTVGSVNIFSQVLISIHTGVLAYYGIVTIGSTSSTGNISSNIFNSVSQMSNNLFVMNSIDIYFEKYNSFEENNDSIEENNKDTPENIFEDNLKLKDISFSINDKPILNDVDLNIYKGGKYALIGESGSGKSTLLNLISGKIDNYDGDIILDGNKIENNEVKNMRNNVIYISQNPYLFNDSVANNISLGRTDDMEEIKSVMRLLDINEYALPNDEIQEHGKNLSGGQKQRISFARALLNDNENKILLLDESTTNLDKPTALKLENIILDNKNITGIMVTHHLYDENKNKFDKIINLSEKNN